MAEQNTSGLARLRLAALQFDITWLDKPANLRQIDELTADLPEVDLLVLPEAFASGFAVGDTGSGEPPQGGLVLEWMQSKAEQLSAVVAGSVWVTGGSTRANRFYWVWPDGRVDYYDKRHLFSLGNEQDFVNPGMERKIFTVKGVRILPQVCYDLRFPVWSRNRGDYDLLVNVANWPEARRDAWDSLLKARAIENQAYVLGVNRVGMDGKGQNYSGGSGLFDYAGKPVSMAQDNRPHWFMACVDLEPLARFKQQFPFYRDADPFSLLP